MINRPLLAIILAASTPTGGKAADPRWSAADLTDLSAVFAAAEAEGLGDRPERSVVAGLKPSPYSDIAADAAALRLARDYMEGSPKARDDRSWHFEREHVDYPEWLAMVLDQHAIIGSFRALLPTSAAYGAIRAEYGTCRQQRRDCTALSTSLDRLRALPRDLGKRYLWVNIPAFRLDVIDGGMIVASHKVIVGKPATQTPGFRATVTGVTINPWWNVPCSIVDESIGALIRDKPAEAARRGFVATKRADGTLSVRQKPGPNNALGQIKLEMPNSYGVYIHDTPSKSLFQNDLRAYSHGCIRTEAPASLAISLLGREQQRSVDLLLASGVSRTLPLTKPLPVYVVYMTAELDPRTGKVVTYDDVYHRDD